MKLVTTFCLSLLVAGSALACSRAWEPRMGAADVSILRLTATYRERNNCMKYGPCSKHGHCANCGDCMAVVTRPKTSS